MNFLNSILKELRNGNLNVCLNNKAYINEVAMMWLAGKRSDKEKDELDTLMRICNIVYGNTDSQIMIVEDGVYDLLQEKYKSLFPNNYQVGTEVIQFDNVANYTNDSDEKIEFFHFISDEEKAEKEDMFFKEDIIDADYVPSYNDFKRNPIHFEKYISKRQHTKEITHPDLVGTLDKCKFVLTKDAEELGVEDDANVKILERDFFQDHIARGIISPTEVYDMVVELKYDGVSIDGTCTHMVLEADSRGDTGMGVSSDMTPLLEGYTFPNVPKCMFEEPLGIKFEAIITNSNLYKFCQIKGKSYSNGRSAIVGLLGSSDAWKYRDCITLVPLQLQKVPGMEDDRLVEIEFLNKYFAKGEKLRYAVIRGTYIELLYQIDLFRREALFSRRFLPFMYDGIVVSYLDPEIRAKLGRKNFVNKYSMAVKFDPLEKESEFLGYSYTVGQDGSITPMIHYNPVEFYGTIHNKSTGHSYKRFKELDLRLGDILDIKYVNDVMPYVYKANNSFNTENEKNPPVPFITNCPECGTELLLSKSGKSMYCPNKNCEGRYIARVVNMLDKLNFNDFSESYIRQLKITSLKDMITLDPDKVKDEIGEVMGNKFLDRRADLFHRKSIKDYEIVGALGFTNIGKEKWKLILNKVSLDDLVFGNPVNKESGIFNPNIHNIVESFIHIKGIGKVAVETINDEIEFFKDDLMIIADMNNVVHTTGYLTKKQIRFTGVRNKELIEKLSAEGYDITDGGVTKNTDILIVPFDGFTSAKTKKVSPVCIIVSIDDFIANMEKYL